ncbi:3'(2'),5'-bisphosphate nucleotidase [Paludisphaera soli]|uniref:3'(2'),5'-bisphosphate nucleotidase n=1 Tax=Paludisphaera soli TaxID=2712865 RepID=UPI001F110106|nr:3'(2'),5'-bisphosphate nucleotidase [Paludisphaera soli]
MMDGTSPNAAFEREREVATAAVRDAAILCRAVQRGLETAAMDKEDRSPVTIADFGSQALICRTLAEAFPGDRIVAEEDAAMLRRAGAEESASRVLKFVQGIRPEADGESVLSWIDLGRDEGGAGRFWTLDPIDGTKGFLRGGQYAVALALIVDGRIEVAAMACPNLPVRAGDEAVGAVFTAVRGEGAEVRPLDAAGPATPIRVGAGTDPRDARICESVESGHSAQDQSALVAERLGVAAAPVRLDSQAKYAVVARGEADIYLRLPTRKDYREKIWDHAAGALILAEAGGVVTDVTGRPLDFTKGRELSENRGVVATNGTLHDRVIAALAEAYGSA